MDLQVIKQALNQEVNNSLADPGLFFVGGGGGSSPAFETPGSATGRHNNPDFNLAICQKDKSSVSDPYSSNPDPAKNLNPDPKGP